MNDRLRIEFYGERPRIKTSAVFELIDQTAKNLRRIQRLTVRDSGLTPPQYQVLKTLWERGDLPLKDLAVACNCTRATITGLVDTLEGKGLVKRQPNPQDRRSLLAALTPDGLALQHQTQALDKVYD